MDIELTESELKEIVKESLNNIIINDIESIIDTELITKNLEKKIHSNIDIFIKDEIKNLLIDKLNIDINTNKFQEYVNNYLPYFFEDIINTKLKKDKNLNKTLDKLTNTFSNLNQSTNDIKRSNNNEYNNKILDQLDHFETNANKLTSIEESICKLYETKEKVNQNINNIDSYFIDIYNSKSELNTKMEIIRKDINNININSDTCLKELHYIQNSIDNNKNCAVKLDNSIKSSEKNTKKQLDILKNNLESLIFSSQKKTDLYKEKYDTMDDKTLCIEENINHLFTRINENNNKLNEKYDKFIKDFETSTISEKINSISLDLIKDLLYQNELININVKINETDIYKYDNGLFNSSLKSLFSGVGNYLRGGSSVICSNNISMYGKYNLLLTELSSLVGNNSIITGINNYAIGDKIITIGDNNLINELNLQLTTEVPYKITEEYNTWVYQKKIDSGEEYENRKNILLYEFLKDHASNSKLIPYKDWIDDYLSKYNNTNINIYGNDNIINGSDIFMIGNDNKIYANNIFCIGSKNIYNGEINNQEYKFIIGDEINIDTDIFCSFNQKYRLKPDLIIHENICLNIKSGEKELVSEKHLIKCTQPALEIRKDNSIYLENIKFITEPTNKQRLNYISSSIALLWETEYAVNNYKEGDIVLLQDGRLVKFNYITDCNLAILGVIVSQKNYLIGDSFLYNDKNKQYLPVISDGLVIINVEDYGLEQYLINELDWEIIEHPEIHGSNKLFKIGRSKKKINV